MIDTEDQIPRIAYAALRGVIEWLPSWDACPDSIKACLEAITSYVINKPQCTPNELLDLLREFKLDSVADIPIAYDAMRACRSLILDLACQIAGY